MAVGKLVLYHSPPTRSTRIFWLLTELDLPFEVKRFDFFNKREELSTPEHMKVHPLGGLPILKDDDTVVWESLAIMEYILEKYGKGRLAPAVGTPERARFLTWLNFGEATFAVTLVGMLTHAALLPEEQRVPSEAARLQAALLKILDLLERELADRPYIVGQEFTAADIVLGQLLYLAANIAKLVTPEKHPKTYAYLQRLLSERPAFKKACE